MSVDWGLEYLRGIFPPTGPEQSAREQARREKPVVSTNYQEVNPSEIQKSQAPPQIIAGPANSNAVGPLNHVQQSHYGHADVRELLDSIVAYLRKYLVCDDHQYTVLALWIFHTWIFRNFRSVAYLDIRSPESQSGKTLCLQLLEALCNDPLIAAGLEPATMVMSMLVKDKIMDNRDRARSTLLFDDCQHTFAPSERQRIVAMLNSGSRIPCLNMDRTKVYDAFNPKAFATSARLPRSLAARCIPILLRRKKTSEVVTRFHGEEAETEANVNLKKSLESWVNANEDLFEDARNNLPTLPPAFTARQQECAEPLVYIADIAGGPWPQRARTALVALFEVADCSEGLQMLSDIRSIFHLRNNPEELLTRDILAELITHENRPWGGWHAKSWKKLGAILGPFNIFSRDIWDGKGNLKGYKLKSFQDAWERYLPPIEPGPTPEAAEHSSSR
ncbi:MAG TPA: DUF3631 domain-containing protein [Candidatus Angelobacter sp.]